MQYLSELSQIAISENDTEILSEIDWKASALQQEIEDQIETVALSGTHDHLPAIITIQAGTGGREAQYWAQTLLTMYTRWASLESRPQQIMHVSHGEKTGVRQAVIQIGGINPYGILKSEAGVHRLSRVSDFDPAGKRQTSFARVELFPDVPTDQAPSEMPKKDIKIDVFHASGPGGQHVQKVATAVRITHLPTGTVAAAQSERSQKQNKETAMRILTAKLEDLHIRKKDQDNRNLRGEQPPAKWGNQMRSYILNPNQLVADHRTGFKSGNAQAILNGNLKPLLKSYLEYVLTKVPSK